MSARTAAGEAVAEVVGADLPVEPGLGSVAVDATGQAWQRQHVGTGLFRGLTKTAWFPASGTAQPGRTWTELLARGPLTIVWLVSR